MSRFTSSFLVQNTELENYSFNLVHYFLEKQGYSIFNFEEKILENFNHDYYNIVYIYTKPLINDVNIEALIEKVSIIKKKLRKNFFIFNQQILVLATNCDINTSKIEFNDDVAVINATDKDKLLKNSIIQKVYPDMKNVSLDLDFQSLTVKLNILNIQYIKKISAIFNKKQIFINVIIAFALLFFHFSSLLNLPVLDVSRYLMLTKENIMNHQYYTLLTNNFFNTNLLSLAVSVFLLVTFGLRLERIYGSFRYLIIILLTMLISNSLLFAFINTNIYTVGFTPIVYTFIGSFIYVVILFRRYLASIIKRLLYLNLFFFFIILLFGDKTSLISLIGSLSAGFICSFIVGIPKAKNGLFIHRLLALIFIFIIVFLSLSIGLK